MNATMRAAIVTGPGRVEVVRAPIPSPAPSQALIRLEGCGVCASNLAPWAGPSWMRFPTEPGALGHEGWGIVEAIGALVTGVSVGDRVGVLSHHAYAEFDVADMDALVSLPPALDGRMFPAEPLGCAMNVWVRSDIRPGQTVAIVGAGFLGAVLTRLAADAGARVIAISRRAFARATALEMGAAAAAPFGSPGEIAAAVAALSPNGRCERVLEAVGSQAALDVASALVADRGRLIIAGYHQDGPRTVDMQQWNWRGIDVINAHERDPAIYAQGMRAAVEAAAAGRLPYDALLTHAFPLEQLKDALDATRDRPDGFLKAVVTF